MIRTGRRERDAGRAWCAYNQKTGGNTITRYSTAILTILLALAGAGGAAAQTSSADKPPVTNNTSGMTGDKEKNAESAPKGPATAGTVNISQGVGAIEGADGWPPTLSTTSR